MKGKTLILISELWQVDKLGDAPSGTVVALDAEVEEVLTARGVSYISAKDYRTPNCDFRDAAHEWAKQVLENPEHPFIEYRSVSLGRVYFYQLYLYFTRLAYWFDIVASLLERHPDTAKLVVYPPSFRATETTADLTQEELNALIDSAKLIGAHKGIDVIVLPAPSGVARRSATAFALKRYLFGALIGASNLLMRLRPARPLRVLVSDYWRNVGPFMPYLPDAELIFIDRLEAFQAGIENIWRWRMLFYHMDDFSSHKKSVLPDEKDPHFTARYRGYDVSPFLSGTHTALKRDYVPRALRDIDRAYTMLEILHPTVIVLRVSTSSQRHYAILAQVGHLLGIPSVELQHGLEYNGSDSLSIRKNAFHLGVYGSLIKEELASAGIAKERIEVIGSPRFDVYAQVHARRAASPSTGRELNVLCVYPDFSYGDGFDIYDIETYMQGVADALQGIPNAHLTIKLRGARREAFCRRRIAEICKEVPHSIEKNVPLAALFPQCDIAVSCYSTAILEAMQSDTPVVMFAAIPSERRFVDAHFGSYVRARALGLAETPAELASALRMLADEDARNIQTERADRFLTEQYAFDGQSAERAAGLIRRLAKVN